MSFLERAKAQAEQAAQRAKEAAQQAREAASEQAKVAQAAVQRTSATMQDPATAERARQALRRAKRGVSTAIDRIDPNVLADIIIKATALQERANNSLRSKGSLYRVSEVVIGASFPPTINFSIARIGEHEEEVTGNEVASTELVGAVASAEGTIQALDGSTIDESTLLDDEPATDGEAGPGA
jgi:hypothetical protein